MAIWLQVLLWAITNAPTIFKIIKEIMGLIKGMPKGDQKALKLDLKSASKAAKDKRDFRPLQELHERLRARIRGDR